MTISEAEKIDIVGERFDEMSVRLVIVDDMSWSEPSVHEKALQTKVNAYIDFIESGQICEFAPLVARGASIEIRLVAAYSPPARARDFFEQIARAVRELGYDFTVEVRESPVIG